MDRATCQHAFGSRSDQSLEFEISVIASYGSDDLLVAAVRKFRWQDNEGTVKLAAGRTRQVRNRAERTQLGHLAENNDF
jgi:hypothetical protein